MMGLGPTVATDVQFWRRMLGAGGCTTIPRWTRHPVPGEGEHAITFPEQLVAAWRRLAAELTLPPACVLLAAHAKVLAALSGESDVVTGYLSEAGVHPLPCRLTTERRSGRDLVLATHGVAAQLQRARGDSIDDLHRELGLTSPLFETVFDASGGNADLRDGVVLAVATSRPADPPGLRLRYRTDVLDADYAARLAHYYVAALELITTDPDAEHTRQSLLSAAEIRDQIETLAGPRRTLPLGQVPELFEQQVRAHPQAIAAQRGEQRWTYADLNARANRLARALLEQGLQREDVVAVVTARNLDWLAAVLAVFKAGGAYLPIEPHFPAERIASMLSRAESHLVLTEPGSDAMLDQALTALPDVRKLLIASCYREHHSDTNPGVLVTPDQLAYIYFTSGSTGEPKGAMCEHAGMLNHLLAKIEDLEIGPGDVVAQIAPQCFDISLWQLIAALLVGGRTLLVEQDVVLDVPRFVDTIVDGRVAVLQVVPSYLDTVLAYLERRPHDLPDLRYVSATGEALKTELVNRWFAAQPHTRLVNAYGLTETSDDTNHEVMDRLPESTRVPLGRPIHNVHVYVVDDNLVPVPLGAPGLIVFSGVCVGRGYVNDPERTRAAYLADPHRPGERLYRGGDYGRWLPDGKLEFLGRRDGQVKIAGFRIELGDIENTLLRLPGIGDSAVVVTQRPDRSAQLAAFYSGTPAHPDALRTRLQDMLPEYLIPAVFHWQQRLPLTANSKVDRKALTALAAELDAVVGSYSAPTTRTERRLAAVWATVLGIPERQIGTLDNFFDLGGTSLSAVRLAIAMDRAVSLQDLTRHPVLRQLADLLDGRAATVGVEQ